MKRPCIEICRYDDATGWCLGCGMTKLEKKAWKREPAFQPIIAAMLTGRLEALAAADRKVGEASRKR